MRRLLNIALNSGLFTLLLYAALYGSDFYFQYKSMELQAHTLFGPTFITATIDGQPLENVEIELDGEFLGHTPMEITLPAGKHRIVLYGDDPALQETQWEFKLDGLAPKLIKGEFTIAH